MKPKKETRNHVVKIKGAAAKTKGNYNDVSKEQYYYIYPAPPRLRVSK
jgi:hypothetical protein